MKRMHFLPLTLLLLLPLWFVAKLFDGSFSHFFSLLQDGGFLALNQEIFSLSPHLLFIAGAFYFFIVHIAPKYSLTLQGIVLLTLYYTFFTPGFFHDNLNVFIIISALSFNVKDHCSHLFFSLYFVTLLHTFSSLLTCIYFYGYNLSLFAMCLAPIFSLYLLSSKNTYPSRVTLLSLFPALLLPVAYFTHTPSSLDLGIAFGSLIQIATIYTLLERKSYKRLSILMSLSFIPISLLGSVHLYPFLYTPLALAAGIMQLFFSSRNPFPSRTSVLPLPTQPSLPPLHFYNEHMHY